MSRPFRGRDHEAALRRLDIADLHPNKLREAGAGRRERDDQPGEAAVPAAIRVDFPGRRGDRAHVAIRQAVLPLSAASRRPARPVGRFDDAGRLGGSRS